MASRTRFHSLPRTAPKRLRSVCGIGKRTRTTITATSIRRCRRAWRRWLREHRRSRPSRFRTRPSTRSPQATRTDRSARPLVAPVCFKADRSVEGRGAAESPPFFLVRHAGFRYDTTHHLGRWLHLEGLSHGPHHGLWEG